jgi:hypothetical protein
MASKPLSKRNSTPRNKKEIPNAASPTPISETEVFLNQKYLKLLSQIFASFLLYKSIDK